MEGADTFYSQNSDITQTYVWNNDIANECFVCYDSIIHTKGHVAIPLARQTLAGGLDNIYVQ